MTEEQKVQELLKPRYLVIADYPGSEFTINQIIVPQLQNERHEFGSGLILMLSAFPHLFCKLEWWEERKPEEMPEYVKWDDVSKYFPVERVCKASEAPFGANYATRIEPATSAEYTAYIEKQPTTQKGNRSA